MVLVALLAILALVAPSTVRPAAATETPWMPDSNFAHTADTPEGAINTGSPGEYRVIRNLSGRISWAIWHLENWQEIPGGWYTTSAPDILIAGGQLWVFIHGQNDLTTYYNRLLNENTNQWSGWQVVPGTSRTNGTVSAVFAADSVWVFSNQYGALYYSQFSFGGPLRGWANVRQVVPGNAYSQSSPAAATYGLDRDRIALFHRGSDDHLYRQDFNAISRFWSGSWRDLRGVIRSRPTAVATGNLLDIIDVGVRGTDNRPWLISFGEGNYEPTQVSYNWRPVMGPEGNTTDAPSLFANANQGRTYLLVTRSPVNEMWGKQIR
ncbi:MAG TPA: hypothetical protein VGD71_07755 [Kribbella sp.]|jgi:hypothetical protein